MVKLRKKGILTDHDIMLLSGDFEIEKGKKSVMESVFSRKRGRFGIKDLSDREFYEMVSDLENPH